MNEEFVTADCHWGHRNIIRHAHRPWDNPEAMDEAMIAKWNAVVSKGDLVRIFGDYAFNNHGRYFNRLNGRKILVRGSHDKMNLEDLQNCTEVDKTFSWLKNFSGVYYKDLLFKWNGKMYYGVHTCPRVWDMCHYGVPCLFGHSHGRLETWNMSFDVGVDTKLANYAPIHMTVIDQEVERRRKMMLDAGRYIREKNKIIYRQDDVYYMMSRMLRGEKIDVMPMQEQEELVDD